MIFYPYCFTCDVIVHKCIAFGARLDKNWIKPAQFDSNQFCTKSEKYYILSDRVSSAVYCIMVYRQKRTNSGYFRIPVDRYSSMKPYTVYYRVFDPDPYLRDPIGFRSVSTRSNWVQIRIYAIQFGSDPDPYLHDPIGFRSVSTRSNWVQIRIHAIQLGADPYLHDPIGFRFAYLNDQIGFRSVSTRSN